MNRRKNFKKRGNKQTKQVWRNKRKIKMLSKAMELKLYDTDTVTMANVDTAGHADFLNSIAQGNTEHTRDGNECLLRKIKIRGYIQNTNGTPQDGVMRLLLVRYKNQMAATLTIGRLLQNTNSAISTVNTFRNPDYTEQIVVIDDTSFGYDTTQYSQIPFKMEKKLNSENKWDSAGGATGDCLLNGLWLVAVTNQATTANAPSIVYEARTSFCDS